MGTLPRWPLVGAWGGVWKLGTLERGWPVAKITAVLPVSCRPSFCGACGLRTHICPSPSKEGAVRAVLRQATPSSGRFGLQLGTWDLRSLGSDWTQNGAGDRVAWDWLQVLTVATLLGLSRSVETHNVTSAQAQDSL